MPRAAVDDPFTMSGWVNQDIKGWRWQLVNSYNSTVVDFIWAFKANTQGQYQGTGAFLNHVTTVVADIYAAWGYHVSVKAHADEPYNAGTLGAPIAVQELQVTNPLQQERVCGCGLMSLCMCGRLLAPLCSNTSTASGTYSP